jgi:hypothetical protein
MLGALTVPSIDFMIRSERCKVSNEEQIVEQLDRWCFVMMFKHGSIEIRTMKTRFIELDHVRIRIHLRFLMSTVMHFDCFPIERTRNPGDVFPGLERVTGRAPTKHLRELHFGGRRVVNLGRTGVLSCSERKVQKAMTGKERRLDMKYRGEDPDA